jgi:hypothetical protein
VGVGTDARVGVLGGLVVTPTRLGVSIFHRIVDDKVGTETNSSFLSVTL